MSTKPKILYVFCFKNFSGGEIVIQRLITSNSDHVEPIVICPPGEFAEQLKASGIKVYEEEGLISLERRKNKYSKIKILSLIVRKFFKVTKRVFQIISKDQFYYVHANNLSAAFYLAPSLFLIKLYNRKTKWIWSNHDIRYPNGPKDKKLAEFCHKFYDRTLAVSNAVKETHPKFKNKISVLYNGLDIDQFSFNQELRKTFRSQYGINEKMTLIGIAGIISKGKGHHLLINSFKELLVKYPESALCIVGRFIPEEADYEDFIKKEISAFPPKNCILTGQKRNMPEVYSGLDILVNASTFLHCEPLGTTIYEAMACERIVVASDTGGSSEIIDHCQDGYLFKTEDIADLTQKLDMAITNLNTSTEMKRQAREKVIRKFNIHQMTSQYNNLLNISNL